MAKNVVYIFDEPEDMPEQYDGAGREITIDVPDDGDEES